jgi:hypothetical protein
MAAPTSSALPAAFSSLQGLGAPVAFFRAGARARMVPLVCAGLCALGAALALAYGVAVTATAYLRFGPVVVEGLGLKPALLFALFFTGGLVFLAFALLTWNRAVAVYDGGVAFRGLGSLKSWRWGDVVALYAAVRREAGLLTRARHRYTLENASGERATFDDRLAKVTELGALIGHRIVEMHYPPTAARFNAGERTAFGEVAIDQNVIEVKRRAMPWAGVEAVSVRRGFLEVRGRDRTHRGLPVADIPNLDVLLLLLDHITDLRLEE